VGSEGDVESALFCRAIIPDSPFYTSFNPTVSCDRRTMILNVANDLVMRNIDTIAFDLYGCVAYLARHGNPDLGLAARATSSSPCSMGENPHRRLSG
jgi:hypothetical protein